LPAAMVVSGTNREQLLLSHAYELKKFLQYTPIASADAEAETLAIVTKMLFALPGQRASETANEARGEAYLAALEDIPSWAVQEAVRKWYRGEHGPKYDYRWSPCPAELREVAYLEQYPMKSRITMLERVAKAVALVEYRR
jgi:hypothetical protein